MSYDDDWGVAPHRRHQPLPVEWDVEAPTDDVRDLVRGVVADRPGRASSPSRIAADLRRDGVDVPVAQIAGALVEMGYGR